MDSTLTVEIGRYEKVYDYETGEALPIRVLKTTSSQALIELYVEDVPGLSFRRFNLKEDNIHQDGESEVKGTAISNDETSIQL